MSFREEISQVKKASYEMAVLRPEHKKEYLEKFSELILEKKNFLLIENKKDLKNQNSKISEVLFQRLELTDSKLESLHHGIQKLAYEKDKIGEVLEKTQIAENFILEKVRVPIGLIGIVFESRPDVIPQILSLCIQSGNACVLKGGREAKHSNEAFMSLVEELNQQFSWMPKSWSCLLDSREDFQALLKEDDLVDLIIPRGSNELVRFVMESTKIPVLGHAEGVCHLYVHEKAKQSKSIPVIIDSKAQYPSACNALETLLIDRKIADSFLPEFYKSAATNGIQLIGCSSSRAILPKIKEATDEDWRTEYGDLRLSLRVVDSFDCAIEHINQYGSHHTDGILTEDPKTAEFFLNEVDSASVFWNCSTRFADGYRFGMGAEVGISTNKTHARGPVGIEGLCIYKYKLRGDGEFVGQFESGGAKHYHHQKLDL